MIKSINIDTGVDASYTSDKSPNPSTLSCHEKYDGDTNYGTDAFGAQIVQGEGLPRTIDILDRNGDQM